MIAWNRLSEGPLCVAIRCDGCVGFLGPLSRRIPLRACLLGAGFCLLSVCIDVGATLSGRRFAVGRPLHTNHLPGAWLVAVGRCVTLKGRMWVAYQPASLSRLGLCGVMSFPAFCLSATCRILMIWHAGASVVSCCSTKGLKQCLLWQGRSRVVCMCMRGSVCTKCSVCVCMCVFAVTCCPVWLFVSRLLRVWRLCEVWLAVSIVMVPAALKPTAPHPFQPVSWQRQLGLTPIACRAHACVRQAHM